MDTGPPTAYNPNVARPKAGFYQRLRQTAEGWEHGPEGKPAGACERSSNMAKDGPRIIVKMESTAGTGFYYTTTKNRRNTQAKLELRKYDPVAKKHVVFKEKKV
ncbi:hypothetical protein Dalu01_01353 [Deinococcus aluminii]